MHPRQSASSPGPLSAVNLISLDQRSESSPPTWHPSALCRGHAIPHAWLFSISPARHGNQHRLVEGLEILPDFHASWSRHRALGWRSGVLRGHIQDSTTWPLALLQRTPADIARPNLASAGGCCWQPAALLGSLSDFHDTTLWGPPKRPAMAGKFAEPGQGGQTHLPGCVLLLKSDRPSCHAFCFKAFTMIRSVASSAGHFLTLLSPDQGATTSMVRPSWS
jgi:hypothetical protein